MSRMKGQDKTSEKQLNEVEIGKIPEKEFRIMIMKLTQHLGKRMEAFVFYHVSGFKVLFFQP